MSHNFCAKLIRIFIFIFKLEIEMNIYFLNHHLKYVLNLILKNK